jgi:hypothetical protein
MYEKWKKKRKLEINSTSGYDDDNGVGNSQKSSTKNPNFRHNSKIKSELRDVSEIRKIRDSRDKNKMKNMSKGKRKSVLDKRKKKQ